MGAWCSRNYFSYFMDVLSAIHDPDPGDLPFDLGETYRRQGGR